MKTVRIFISSPGDVAEERHRARQVVEQLRRRYAGRLELRPVLWEELALGADTPFQSGIDRKLAGWEIDIAVFILWSRLGSPVGPLIQRENGSFYRSGTEREFDLMLKARALSADRRPEIMVYVRSDETTFDERLRGKATEEKDDLIAQKKLVESFIREEFHDPETGTNTRAYLEFGRPTDFSTRLRTHLQDLIDPMVEGLQAEPVWKIEEHGSPFRGLEAFQPEHAPIFFGREDEILEMRQALRRQACNGCGFLLIAGASGSGKSSLARAGVLPAIVEYELDETISHWEWMIFTPGELGGDPLTGFVERLAETLPALRKGGECWSRSLVDDLRREAEMTVRHLILPALAERRRRGPGEPRLLLLIDQMEELLSGANWSAEDRLVFASLLESLARSGRVWVLATLRADFLGAIQSLPPLVRMRSDGGQSDLLPPDVAALHRLITEPARLAGLRFEEPKEREGKTVADRILHDAAGHPELLPLLGHLLADLYAHRTEDRVLTLARYEAVGGVTGALARHADTTFASPALDEATRNELGRVLRQLVTLGGDDEPVFVRQYPRYDDFPPGQQRLVNVMVEARLLIAGANGTVTLAHEALLRTWLPARAWVEANTDFLRVRARVEARRKEGGLLLEGDPLLETAQTHLAREPEGFSPDQTRYIRESAAQADAARHRRERLRRQVLAGLSLLTLLSLAGGALALWQGHRASVAAAETQRQYERAEHARHSAEQLVQHALYDLRDRLAPINRLDLLDQISRAAEEYFENQPAEPKSDESERERAVMLQNRGDVLLATGDVSGALAAFQRSLEISERLALADPANTGRQRDLSVLQNKISEIFLARGDTAHALEAAEASIRIMESLSAHAPTHPGWQRDLSIACNKLGNVRSAQGDLPAALAAFEQGQAIAERMANADPSDREWQSDLSFSCENLGEVLFLQGDTEAALQALRRSLEIRKELTRVAPGDTGWQRDLSFSYSKIGETLSARGETAAALQALESAREIQERLARNDPSNTLWQHDLSALYCDISEARLAQGDTAGALLISRRAVEIVEPLTQADPSNIHNQRALSYGCCKVGEALLAGGDAAGALPVLRQAMEINQSLSRAAPSDTVWQLDRFQIDTRLGQAFARLHEPARAMEHFGKAALQWRRCRDAGWLRMPHKSWGPRIDAEIASLQEPSQ